MPSIQCLRSLDRQPVRWSKRGTRILYLETENIGLPPGKVYYQSLDEQDYLYGVECSEDG